MCAWSASRETSSVQRYDPWGVPLILRRILLLPLLFATGCNQGKGLRQKAPITLAKDCEGGDRKVDNRLTIVPGDCAVVVVRYAPQNDSDKDDANLVFESDDPQNPTYQVPIQQGAPPHLQVCTVNEAGGDDA